MARINPVTSATWDVELPFTAKPHKVGSSSFAIISDLPKKADVSAMGDWVANGVAIYSVSGDPVTADQSLAALMIAHLRLGDDGRIHVPVRIKLPASGTYSREELALPALRKIDLSGKIGLEVRYQDSAWHTIVVSLQEGVSTDLQVGDILISETASKAAFNSPQAFERAAKAQAAKGAEKLSLEILRGGTSQNAELQLDAQK
ncbi:MAG: hypothetical protein ORN49_10990 [Rhodobacteraceae bacterium]|nr:hypothetical protein [Paracoccaceae bacterium]